MLEVKVRGDKAERMTKITVITKGLEARVRVLGFFKGMGKSWGEVRKSCAPHQLVAAFRFWWTVSRGRSGSLQQPAPPPAPPPPPG